MKWSETITFSPALQEVQLLKQVPAQNWAVYLREREDAAYQNGRRDGEKALGQQLAQQRQEMAGLMNGIVDSLKQTLPRLIQQTESELINLTLASAQKNRRGPAR